MASPSTSVSPPLSRAGTAASARTETLFNWLALLVLLALGFAVG